MQKIELFARKEFIIKLLSDNGFKQEINENCVEGMTIHTKNDYYCEVSGFVQMRKMKNHWKIVTLFYSEPLKPLYRFIERANKCQL